MKRGAFSSLLLGAFVLGGVAHAEDSNRPGPVAEGKTLGEVKVSSEREIPYAARRASAATKTDASLLETPMSVQVVPREVMDDQQVIGIKDAVQNISGVMSAEYEWYDYVQIRGFSNGYAGNYRNGLQLQAITGLDMALVDRIEVVKGPASMLYGRIDPGGLVNLVTKRPQGEKALSVQQQFGSYGQLRTTVDATGRVNEDGTLLYRLIGAYSEADSFMDHVQKRNAVGAAYLSWKPSAAFELNLNFEAQNNRFMDTEDQGIPIIGNRVPRVSRDSYYGDPVNWDIPNRQSRTLLGFDWTLALNDRWKITQRLHWDQRDEQQLTFWFNGMSGPTTLSRGVWFVHPERETIATNIDLLGDVEIGGMRHRLLFGLDWFRFTSDWHGFSGTTPVVPDIDIFRPTYGISASALKGLAENWFYRDHDEWHGFYVQDQISLSNHWELLIGGRYDWARTGNGFDATSLSAARDALDLKNEEAFSPRVGILYKVNPATSFYASYSESFGSNNGRSATGSLFDPQRGKQYEVGAKAQLLGGRLTSSAVLFDLEKSNILTADLSTPDPSDQTPLGKVRSKGLEVDVSGQVSKHVSLIGSYTYDDASITKDNNGNEGNRHPNVPLHSGSLWAKFDSAPGGAEGWEAGGGVYLRGKREGNNANTWQLPGYGRVDAMIGYRTRVAGKKLSTQLNVQNLFDKVYVDRGGFGGTVAKYGSPRTFLGSIKVDF